MSMKEINKTRKEGVENVILTRYLHIGDKVVMNMDPVPRSWGCKGPDNETNGVVVGFFRYKKDYSLIDTYGITAGPGIYEGNGAAIILWEDGTTTFVGGSDVYWGDQSLGDIRSKDKEYIAAYETMVRIADLPKVPYEIGDTVLARREHEGKCYVFTIVRNNYLDIDRKCNDGSPYPYIEIRSVEEGWSSACTEDEVVELISRGNYWKWQHDKESISFKDITEEAAFYKSLGFAVEMKNPRSMDYRWELDEILAAIQEGTVDGIIMSGSFFGCASMPVPYCYPTMPELGKRIREETLKGFADRLKK